MPAPLSLNDFPDPILKPVSLIGKVVQGHQVASGQAPNSPYPKGTLEMQMPHFLALGIDLSPFYLGTLNVSIAPHSFDLKAQKTLHQVKWSAHHAAESFSFVPMDLTWRQQSYRGLVYYPHPDTKINHFQAPDVLELLLPAIAGIAYGDTVILSAPRSELIITNL